MKIVVIGGSGLIGAKLVGRLKHDGHYVVAASPSSGVNTITGDGLPEALEGARVVVDVSNSPSLDATAARDFFSKSAANLMAVEGAAGVRHHILLSIVGTDRLQDSGYFQGKLIQEQLVRESGRPYTIVRATQFFEFMAGIAGYNTVDRIVRLPTAFVQPLAAQDVVETLAKIASQAAGNRIIELAGPESFRLNRAVERVLTASLDERLVVADAHARYFGAMLDDTTLVPAGAAIIAPTTLDEWIGRAIAAPEQTRS
jgi:uncharacterized protein YbjT (DUF2867 family)